MFAAMRRDLSRVNIFATGSPAGVSQRLAVVILHDEAGGQPQADIRSAHAEGQRGRLLKASAR
jgi:hypothetical protein